MNEHQQGQTATPQISLNVKMAANIDDIRAWHERWILANDLSDIYEERPVDIETFVNNPEYMDAEGECWPEIKKDLNELFEGYDSPEMIWKHTEAAFDEGIGAGKSYKASIIITYLVYRALILKDPQKFLGLAKGSGIYFMNMSVRAEQAKKVVFGEIYSRVMNAPWFKSHGYLPSSEVKSELRFPKNIYVIPGNSKETFPLGFNLLGGVMDEAAWYTETESHDVAEEMFNALHNRIKNRFGDKGILVMISSPRYVDDFIEKKMNEAKTNPKIYAKRRTSWDSKPADKFSGVNFFFGGFTIPIEYKAEAERNFERFKRDYMAIPSLALEPYFKQWELVEAAFDGTVPEPFTDGGLIKEEFKGKPGYSYYMHIDLSLVSDATGIAMCHREGSDGNEKIIVDMAMGIKAQPGMEIDLASIRGVVLGLRMKGFSIVKCTYDQFQSASSIQELNKMGVNAELLSVDKTLGPYETLKECIYIGRAKIHKNDKLKMELRRLELIQGKKVDHPQNGSKDIADAVAGAVYNCVANQNDFQFWFAGHSKGQPTTDEQKLVDATIPIDGLVPYGYYKGRRH